MATKEYPIAPARAALGRKLFFRSQAFPGRYRSCATCHRPVLYGTDASAKSIGVEEHRLNARNAPTVLNAALQFKAHWIGDRANVEEQAMKSLMGHASFGNPDFAAVIRKIHADCPVTRLISNKPFRTIQNPWSRRIWGNAMGAMSALVTPSPSTLISRAMLRLSPLRHSRG